MIGTVQAQHLLQYSREHTVLYRMGVYFYESQHVLQCVSVGSHAVCERRGEAFVVRRLRACADTAHYRDYSWIWAPPHKASMKQTCYELLDWIGSQHWCVRQFEGGSGI